MLLSSLLQATAGGGAQSSMGSGWSGREQSGAAQRSHPRAAATGAPRGRQEMRSGGLGPHRMTRPRPCGTPPQCSSISALQASFRGHWKSMDSAMASSAGGWHARTAACREQQKGSRLVPTRLGHGQLCKCRGGHLCKRLIAGKPNKRLQGGGRPGQQFQAAPPWPPSPSQRGRQTCKTGMWGAALAA